MSDGSADDREPLPRIAAIPEPRSWRNWQAVRTGTLPSQIVEMRLYSDAWFVAEAYPLRTGRTRSRSLTHGTTSPTITKWIGAPKVANNLISAAISRRAPTASVLIVRPCISSLSCGRSGTPPTY